MISPDLPHVFPGSADHGVWGLPTAHYTPVAQRHEPHNPSDWARETREDPGDPVRVSINGGTPSYHPL